MILAGLFGLALFVGTRMQPATQVTALAAADDDLTTGSIVFFPIEGNRCRKRLIDNATWTIHDGGEIDCSDALASANNHTRWSTARVDVISRSFRQK